LLFAATVMLVHRKNKRRGKDLTPGGKTPYILTMNAPISRITSKAQTVIPKAVREKLGLKPGDLVRYVFEGKRVVIERAGNTAEDDPFATFTEWASEADEKAYGSL
jgi:antitoxin PrlF